MVKGKSPKTMRQGIGDDCAVLDYGGPSFVLVSTDTFNEGVHFSRDYSTFQEAGFKAAAGAISDIYAMGGQCEFLFVSLAVPKEVSEAQVLKFYKGMLRVSACCGAVIAGGDTTAIKGAFSASITVVGRVARANLKTRSGARPGDLVYLTSPVGYSLAGLTLLQKGLSIRNRVAGKALRLHKTPMPCLRGTALGRLREITSCIDVSDGLSSELLRIAQASKVRIQLDISCLRANKELNVLARFTGLPVDRLILESGEEYALLLTSRKPLKLPGLITVGCVERGLPGVYQEAHGKEVAVAAAGYVHFKSR